MQLRKNFFLTTFLLFVGFICFGKHNPGIIFIENKGQWPEEVRFSAEIPGGRLFIEEQGLTYSFEDPQQSALKAHGSHLFQNNHVRKNFYAMKVRFLNTALGTKYEGNSPSPTLYSFFYGNDATKWASGAKGYSTVVIHNLYEGIDLEIYSENNSLKYDFKVMPGADPSCIEMEYMGASTIKLNDETLTITTPYQTLKESIPASFAFCSGHKRTIGSSYRLQGDVVSFDLEKVEPEESVIIDPLLIFSTYSGSVADNWGNTATFDDSGNAYSGGMTNPIRGEIYLGEFPATEGAFQEESGGGWDVAILKYDSAGHDLLYATHLGGSGTEVPQSLIVNDKGELLILGVTGSANFPVTPNAYDPTFNGGTNHTLIGGVDFPNGSDLFVAKLSADGTQLLASTYIGGTSNDGRIPSDNALSRNYGDESRGDINFDSKGNVVVSSRTSSDDFPIVHGFSDVYGGGSTDALVFKLSEELDNLLWSTFLGGAGTDVALSIKVDTDDNIYVAGGTNSDDFPTTTDALEPVAPGSVDGWVAHIYSDGDSLISSTYIGTTAYDQVFFMDLDANSDVYLAGQTTGGYPVTPGIYTSGQTGQFIHKLSSDLKTSEFSTVINSAGRTLPAISLTAFLVNDCNNIYLAGWGSPSLVRDDNDFMLNTQELPITQDAYQKISDGSSFYLMVLSGDASELLYATHLGDGNSLVHVDGGTSRFDKHGIVYHSVCASCFGDSSFPTTEGAWSEVNGSTGCNNALFKFDLASLRARLQTNNISLTQPGLQGGCSPLEVVFENLSVGGEIYEWNFGDGTDRTSTTLDTIAHTYPNPGIYQVRLRASDPNTCVSEDFAYTTISVSAPNFSVSEDKDICQGESVQLIALGGSKFTWYPPVGLSDVHVFNPIATPDDTTTYQVEIANSNGCNYLGEVTVNVVPAIDLDVRIERSNLCQGSRAITIDNKSKNITNVVWMLGDGTLIEPDVAQYEFLTDGEYVLNGVLENQECSEDISIPISVKKLNIPNVITRNGDGKNDKLVIISSGPVDLTIYTRWGAKVYSQKNYQNDWKGDGLSTGVYYYEVVLENNEICTGWVHLLE